jgi:transcriptional regulator with XRE-family HTH domain
MNMKPINPTKRLWMKSLRKEKKLTLLQIAPLLEMSWQHYSDIENGRRNPSVEASMKMAKFFDVSLEKFFEDRTKFTSEEKLNELTN